jgi:hypothetical protein
MVNLIRLTKSDCKHEWVIAASTDLSFQIAPDDVDGEGTWVVNGRYSPGVCNLCKERKQFLNSPPAFKGISL